MLQRMSSLLALSGHPRHRNILVAVGITADNRRQQRWMARWRMTRNGQLASSPKHRAEQYHPLNAANEGAAFVKALPLFMSTDSDACSPIVPFSSPILGWRLRKSYLSNDHRIFRMFEPEESQ
jgi:hypothetical protein